MSEQSLPFLRTKLSRISLREVKSEELLKNGHPIICTSSGSGFIANADTRATAIFGGMPELKSISIPEGTAALRQRARGSRGNKSERAQRAKADRNRQAVKEVIRRTLVEIVEDSEWRSLQEALQVLHKEAAYPVGLKLDNDTLRGSRVSIINELKIKRNQWVEELRNADQHIALLRDKIKDTTQNANARISYVDKWLFARAESLELRMASEPRAPAPRVDHEDRVHKELVKAYELQIKERQDALDHWRQKYLHDTTKINEHLAMKCEQLRVAVAKRQELQELYNLHEGEMRGWLTFKRERAARLAREERINAAAKKIQAWWRGVMVRKALGSFKFLKNMKKSPSKSKKK